MVRFPDNGPWIVEVYDATGRKVGMLQSSTTPVDLDLRSASSGIYLLRAVTVDGRILSSKVVR
ncbi:MAG: T9SS type A sorting domain-containing protein [Flavobacteriales bacterium]|nr:T9SS type A sorting domain-containing protein [Flavobacteriales bacterium]